jgi:nucleoside-diphosphate-sugar epimerase
MMKLIIVTVALGVLNCALAFSATRSLTMMALKPLSSSKVLIVQNKGGGHGSLGYYLAKSLHKLHPGVEVTLWQDKTNYKKDPFHLYAALKAESKTAVHDVDMASMESPPEPNSFDYIIDNWSKGTGNATFIANFAGSGPTGHLLFVSSAGMYTPEHGGVFPILETDKVKEKNDPRQAELAYQQALKKAQFTAIRPQYLYGEYSSKRYLDYFLDKAQAGQPIPLPKHGDQLVCLTHQEDAADLITAACQWSHVDTVGVLNCGSDRLITYKGLCEALHNALGSSADHRQYVHYDPSLPASKGYDDAFPFRADTFVTSVGRAKQVLAKLGWAGPKHSLQADIVAEVKSYLASKK